MNETSTPFARQASSLGSPSADRPAPAAATLAGPRAVGPSTAQPPAVELSGLVKRFGPVTAVDGLDLRIEPGEIVAFLGPNGAGKTTTIDMVLGLTRPDRGSARVLGGTPAQAVAHGRVSAVMQTGGLLRDLTVAETIRLTATLYSHVRPVEEVLGRAGITELADRRVGKCSGGQQQRLRFALALLPDPDLMVLDEPTTGMDVEGRRDFWSAIRQDASCGRTVLFATHYLDEADAYADRIVLMHSGRVVADGTPARIKNLASGRTVSATLPGADQVALLSLPGVESVEVRGDRVLVRAADSDPVARHLLTATQARDLEITAHNLEDAFLTLTSDAPAADLRAARAATSGRSGPTDPSDQAGSTDPTGPTVPTRQGSPR